MFIQRKSLEKHTNTLLFKRVLHGDCEQFVDSVGAFCYSYSPRTGDSGADNRAEHEHSNNTRTHGLPMEILNIYEKSH